MASSPTVILLVLVIGLPGAGKSTFISHLQQQVGRGNGVPCTEEDPSQQLFLDHILKKDGNHHLHPNHENSPRITAVWFSPVEVFSLDEMMKEIALDSKKSQNIKAEMEKHACPPILRRTGEEEDHKEEMEKEEERRRKEERKSVEEGGGNPSSSFFPQFTPDLWKKSNDQLFKAVEDRLRALVGLTSSPSPSSSLASSSHASSTTTVLDPFLSSNRDDDDDDNNNNNRTTSSCLHGHHDTGTCTLTVKLVLVEDNMPLRSMRERYWKLCRCLEDELHKKEESSAKQKNTPCDGGGAAPPPPPSMHHFPPILLELRIHAFLQECIDRNEERCRRIQNKIVDSSHSPSHHHDHHDVFLKEEEKKVEEIGSSILTTTSTTPRLACTESTNHTNTTSSPSLLPPFPSRSNGSSDNKSKSGYEEGFIRKEVIIKIFNSFEYCYPHHLLSYPSSTPAPGLKNKHRFQTLHPSTSQNLYTRRKEQHSSLISHFLLLFPPLSSSPAPSIREEGRQSFSYHFKGQADSLSEKCVEECVGGYEWVTTTSEWLVLQQFQSTSSPPPGSTSSSGKEADGEAVDFLPFYPHHDPPNHNRTISVMVYEGEPNSDCTHSIPPRSSSFSSPSLVLSTLFLHSVLTHPSTWKRFVSEQIRMREMRESKKRHWQREAQKQRQHPPHPSDEEASSSFGCRHPHYYPPYEHRGDDTDDHDADHANTEHGNHKNDGTFIPQDTAGAKLISVQEGGIQAASTPPAIRGQGWNALSSVFPCNSSCPKVLYHLDQHLRHMIRQAFSQHGEDHKEEKRPQAQQEEEVKENYRGIRSVKEKQKVIQALKRHTLRQLRVAMQEQRKHWEKEEKEEEKSQFDERGNEGEEWFSSKKMFAVWVEERFLAPFRKALDDILHR